MRNFREEYEKKVISIEDAVRKVESDMEVVVGQVSVPEGLMGKLHTIADKVRNVKVFYTISDKEFEWFINPEMKGHFELCSWFHGPSSRAAQAKNPGIVSYQPNLLHNIGPDHLRARKANIFFGACTPPDKHGYVALGLSVVYEKTMVENADMVILEVSENLPRIFGDAEVHIDQVDFFVKYNHIPAIAPDAPEPDEIDLSIGKHIADLVEDGSTLQLGIGGIPNAVGKCLRNKNDLGIHTEMFVDSMMELSELGVVTNRKKSIYKGKSVCAFIMGTKRLYEWVDDNVSVLTLKAEWVNDPSVIRQNSSMVSINTCMMVDLTGQVIAEGIGTSQYSGTGGQFDTAFGAREAYDGLGKSIIACRSTAKGGTASTIVALPPSVRRSPSTGASPTMS